jgi:hypothetical protein
MEVEQFVIAGVSRLSINETNKGDFAISATTLLDLSTIVRPIEQEV